MPSPAPSSRRTAGVGRSDSSAGAVQRSSAASPAGGPQSGTAPGPTGPRTSSSCRRFGTWSTPRSSRATRASSPASARSSTRIGTDGGAARRRGLRRVDGRRIRQQAHGVESSFGDIAQIAQITEVSVTVQLVQELFKLVERGRNRRRERGQPRDPLGEQYQPRHARAGGNPRDDVAGVDDAIHRGLEEANAACVRQPVGDLLLRTSEGEHQIGGSFSAIRLHANP